MKENKTRKLLIELSIYSLLFALSFVLPVSISYANYSMREIPRYLPDSPIVYVSLLLFIVVILAIISKRKAIIHTVNIFAILLTLMLYLVMSLGHNWSGGHYQPDFGYGYYLSQLFISVLIIRSYTLLDGINEYPFNPRLSLISGIVAIAIPSVLFLLFIAGLLPNS
jgi:hypothetical protein